MLKNIAIKLIISMKNFKFKNIRLLFPGVSASFIMDKVAVTISKKLKVTNWSAWWQKQFVNCRVNSVNDVKSIYSFFMYSSTGVELCNMNFTQLYELGVKCMTNIFINSSICDPHYKNKNLEKKSLSYSAKQAGYSSFIIFCILCTCIISWIVVVFILQLIYKFYTNVKTGKIYNMVFVYLVFNLLLTFSLMYLFLNFNIYDFKYSFTLENQNIVIYINFLYVFMANACFIIYLFYFILKYNYWSQFIKAEGLLEPLTMFQFETYCQFYYNKVYNFFHILSIIFLSLYHFFLILLSYFTLFFFFLTFFEMGLSSITYNIMLIFGFFWVTVTFYVFRYEDSPVLNLLNTEKFKILYKENPLILFFVFLTYFCIYLLVGFLVTTLSENETLTDADFRKACLWLFVAGIMYNTVFLLSLPYLPQVSPRYFQVSSRFIERVTLLWGLIVFIFFQFFQKICVRFLYPLLYFIFMFLIILCQSLLFFTYIIKFIFSSGTMFLCVCGSLFIYYFIFFLIVFLLLEKLLMWFYQKLKN